MKEQHIEEKELSLEEIRKTETEAISLSSPIEEMQKEYKKQLKKLSYKKCQKIIKIYLFIIALIFGLLCVYILILIRKNYAIMKKKDKNISNIKSLDSKGVKLNNTKIDNGAKIEKENKRRNINTKERKKEKNEIKKHDKIPLQKNK